MTANLHSLTNLRDQHVCTALGSASDPLRNFVSAGALCAMWARRLLSTGDYTKHERQALHDITRMVRMTAADRSAFGVILRLAPRAGHSADTFAGLEFARAGIVARIEHPTAMDEDTANVLEEDTNRNGNVAVQRHQRRRTRDTLEEVVHSMALQKFASQLVADASVAAMARR